MQRPPLRSSVEQQWIKANMLGAAGNAVAGFLVYGLARLFAVDEAGANPVLITIFSALAVALTTGTIVLYGFLLAVVLRQKIPSFPMQNWLALYVVFGTALGVLTAYTSTFPEDANAAPATEETVRGLIIGAMVSGAVFGFLMGLVQAAMLREVARELATWVRFSALSGTALAVLVASSLIWPQTGFANEIQSEIATFVASLLGAVIMLPAVSRIERRR